MNKKMRLWVAGTVGNAQAALEDVALWHERDISHSSVERVILPDSTIALDYMLQTFTRVIDKLLVYPDKMMKDLNLTGGLIYSPIILNTLVEKGAVREQAYRWVQRNAMKRWLEGEDFLENLKNTQNFYFIHNSDNKRKMALGYKSQSRFVYSLRRHPEDSGVSCFFRIVCFNPVITRVWPRSCPVPQCRRIRPDRRYSVRSS